MSRRLPNPPGPNLHQVAEVDQEGVGIVRKNWDWGPRPVQLGLQPIGPASPQEGESVVVGVLRVQDLGTWLAIGLVSSQSQLTCSDQDILNIQDILRLPEVCPFSIQKCASSSSSILRAREAIERQGSNTLISW